MILLISLLVFLSPLAGADNSKYFAEYIGSEFTDVKFSDVPINSGVDFHFILSFAADFSTTISPPSSTDGNFIVYWDTDDLSADHINAIKQANPNVKVALSLGGDTVSGNPVLFKPTTVFSWVLNAASSLTRIIQENHLDGIDIDYEHFQADPATFAVCIGALIKILKKNNVISFASIAPYGRSDVQQHYQALWANYGDVIDYVNFQFYAYSSDTTVDQLLNYFEEQSSNYAGGKVLMSLTGDATRGLTPANGFFDVCRKLKEEEKLAGIFVWDADSSKSGGFQYEITAQNLLAS
ncbi:Chitinase 2 [Dendrobium catenatum]|uniref:Chitinase 2 n=2 Tax=Dendrobium catenatum TaxID=906689 RepID=A0A2I0VJA9_9ASPA|nr:Chitinase 2 [Dendrobium catenatum]